MIGDVDDLINHLFELSTINQETGCILYHGPKSGKGYGSICWNGGQYYVHRIAYQIDHPNEELNVIRHSCDTPNCWRVEHLANGTTQDNVNDKVRRERQPRGETMYSSVVTEDIVRDIRSSKLNLYQLAMKHNITPSNVHYIRARKTWKHVI